MLFEHRPEEQLQKGSVLVGYDLGNDFAQISFCRLGEQNVESVPTVMGTKQYNIPSVLYKRRGVNQWFYGKDALKNSEEDPDNLITDFVAAAKKGKTIVVEDKEYDPTALLTLFMKRSLALMNFAVNADKIASVMFTIDDLDDRMIEVLATAAANLNLKTDRIYFQSHTESLYYFMLHQPKELWNHQVIACEHNGVRLRTYRYETNKRTTPIVVLIDVNDRTDVILPAQTDEDDFQKMEAYRQADEKFLAILNDTCEGKITDTAYLLGDGFHGDWAKESLKYLCRNKRVFQGNNLFCKGACFALSDKFDPCDNAKSHVFLGDDKLKSNIGMNVIKSGKDSYYALLDAGVNWFDADKEIEFLMPGEVNTFFVVITPLTGQDASEVRITLEDAPIRPKGFTRYKMSIKLTSPEEMVLTVRDMGFGEIFPSTGCTWEKKLFV